MHIYHFILDHRIGGPHIYVRTLADALSGKVSNTVITTGKGAMSEITLFNLRHYWMPFYAIEILLNVLYIAWKITNGRISRSQAIFHVHGAANVAPLVAAWLMRIPVLWLIHDTTPRFKGLVNLGKLFMNSANKILATVSQKSISVYGLNNAELLPAAVDPSFWSSQNIPTHQLTNVTWNDNTSDAKRPISFLTVGNLNPLKGLDVLLSSLYGFDRPFHLKIVGSELDTHSKYSDRLHDLAETILRQDRDSKIEFLGWQDKDSVRTLFLGCDIFVLPSRSEACPIALLEAMSMGCHCVATDVGDVRLIMGNADGCELVLPGSPAALREGINRALQSKKVSKVNLPRLDAKWHLQQVASSTLGIYMRLLGTR